MTTVERRRGNEATGRGAGATVSLIGLLVMEGLAAVAGGVSMLADPTGATLGADVGWLDDVPLVSDFVVPGLLLTGLLGIVPLVLATGLVRRFPLPWVAGLERRIGTRWPLVGAQVFGAGTMLWILVQWMWIARTAAVQYVVFGMGAAILVLAFLPSVRARYRA